MLQLAGGSVIGGMAGCVGSSDSGVRTVSVTGIDEADNEWGVEFDIEVVREKMTAEQTAVVSISVKNTGTDPVNLGIGPNVPFGGAGSVERDRGLLLYTTDQRESAILDDDGCWVVTRPPDFTTGYYSMPLAPQEGEQDQLEVLGDGDHVDGPCPPPGDYRFEDGFPNENAESDDVPPIVWGFTLTLTDPTSNQDSP